jgi:hypothetical protein
MRNTYEILVGKPEEKILHAHGRTIMKWILKIQDVKLCTGFDWFSRGLTAVLL